MNTDFPQNFPLISVIIPVYNNPDSLEKTLKSVVKQTYSNMEIIVVDDGSDTDIYIVIKKTNDKRIVYHKLEHQNANVARNHGINISKGKYIAMIDADDLWMEKHIENSLKFLLQEQVDGIYGSLILKNTHTGSEQKITARHQKDDETMIDYLLTSGYGAQTSTLFMTSDSVKKVMWDESLNRHQDYDFIIRYSKQYKLSAKTEPTVVYIIGDAKQFTIDFESCIRVIKENKNDISPNVYNWYIQYMLKLAISQKVSSHIVEYYQNELIYYKEYISFAQFIMIKQPRTKFQKLKYKLEYLFHILRVRIEIE